jgi:hypothetical protein
MNRRHAFFVLLAALLCLAATRQIDPDSFDQLLKDPPASGDTVLFADGHYTGVWMVASRGVTYRAESGNAIFEAIRLRPEARENLFDRLQQAGSPTYYGIAIQGHDNTFRGVTARDNTTHGFLFECMSKDEPCTDPPTGNLLIGVESFRNGNTGIKFDAGARNEIRGCHIHHNGNMGLLEGGDNVELKVHDCEIDNNRHHGLYLKGGSGTILRNRVHHNSGYGIHCWAACYGTAEKRYRIIWNDIFENGSGGTVIGGTSKEASPPGDGFAHFIRYQHNRERDNGDWPPGPPPPAESPD